VAGSHECGDEPSGSDTMELMYVYGCICLHMHIKISLMDIVVHIHTHCAFFNSYVLLILTGP
jgi:hypothetical protein